MADGTAEQQQLPGTPAPAPPVPPVIADPPEGVSSLPPPKRGRGRPPGAKNKKNRRPPPRARAEEGPAGAADPFAGDVKPPPADRPGARPVVEEDDDAGDDDAGGPVETPPPVGPTGKPLMGETRARAFLPFLFSIMDATGGALAHYVLHKSPPKVHEIIDQTMPLTEEERKNLEEPLVAELAKQEMKDGDDLLFMIGTVYVAKAGTIYAQVKRANEDTAAATQAGANGVPAGQK